MYFYDLLTRDAVKTLNEHKDELLSTLITCYKSGIRDIGDIKSEEISKLHPELQDALDELTLDEFMNYLAINYPVKFSEITHYRLYFTN